MRDPLEHLFPGLKGRPPILARRDGDEDRDGDSADVDDLSVPPRRDRRPTDGNRGYTNDTGRGDRHRVYVPPRPARAAGGR